MISLVTLILSADKLDLPKKEEVRNIIRELGFDTYVVSDKDKKLPLPDMVFCGKFEGATAGKIRDDVTQLVYEPLKSAGVKTRAMVLVSNGYAWGLRSV
ncbi:hypothetical protein [Pseudomonas sp. Irchel s3h17]|uniref:hypothetical protein n=1 Tax=Pseudomonas sp. Irchel s3h17 TaxID=2009182 RepID=UPI000BA31216|nr:hypothetical protein [Pseudomonas sp. Irchel s3h17]